MKFFWANYVRVIETRRPNMSLPIDVAPNWSSFLYYNRERTEHQTTNYELPLNFHILKNTIYTYILNENHGSNNVQKSNYQELYISQFGSNFFYMQIRPTHIYNHENALCVCVVHVFYRIRLSFFLDSPMAHIDGKPNPPHVLYIQQPNQILSTKPYTHYHIFSNMKSFE